MSAIPTKYPDSAKSQSSKKSTFMVIGIIGAITAVGLFYMTWYVAPEQITEQVKIIAVTETGCIGETFDGFVVEISPCDAQSGDILMVPVDQKVKERALAMNPS